MGPDWSLSGPSCQLSEARPGIRDRDQSKCGPFAKSPDFIEGILADNVMGPPGVKNAPGEL